MSISASVGPGGADGCCCGGSGGCDATTSRSKRHSDDDDDRDAEASDANIDNASGGMKKDKQKKLKKPKQDIQLMRFADYFGRAFASVGAAQFPWLKIFKESTVAKLVDVSLFILLFRRKRSNLNFESKIRTVIWMEFCCHL